MMLLKRFIRNDLAELHGNGVRVRVIGARDDLLPDIRNLLIEAEELTRDNTSMTLIVAFNYGSRQEIAMAARRLAEDAAAGLLDPKLIDEKLVESRLYTAGAPDPDLIIRTSGEERLSNFLLWQAAYAEFVFLPLHWPEFDRRRPRGGDRHLPQPAAPVRRFGRPQRAAERDDRFMKPAADSDQPPAEAATPSKGQGRTLGDLGVRIASALVMAGLALAALWIGGWLFAAFWTAAGIVIVWEWQHLVGGEGLSLRLGAGAGAVALTAGFASIGYLEAAAAAVALGAAVVAYVSGRERGAWAGAGHSLRRRDGSGRLRPAKFAVLRAARHSLAVRRGVDHGHHGLFRRPADRRAQAVAARVAGQDLVGLPRRRRQRRGGRVPRRAVVDDAGEASLLPLLALGILAAALSQGGDLFESAVKRRFGAKDSSHIIPGHGGMMDRLDGFIFAAVFAAIAGTLHKGALAAAHGLLVW